MGYKLPKKRVLIRPNKESKTENDKWEVQTQPNGKWWKFSSEDECCEFVRGMGGAGGENYPIFTVRDNELVRLVIPEIDQETYAQEYYRKESEKHKSDFKYPEFEAPPKPATYDDIAELAAKGRVPNRPANPQKP